MYIRLLQFKLSLLQIKLSFIKNKGKQRLCITVFFERITSGSFCIISSIYRITLMLLIKTQRLLANFPLEGLVDTPRPPKKFL